MRAQLSEIFSLGSARLHNEAAMATCAHTHTERQVGRIIRAGTGLGGVRLAGWSTETSAGTEWDWPRQDSIRLRQMDTASQNERSRVRAARPEPYPVPGTRPWLQVASVFSFLLRTVRFSHGLLVSVSASASASDWRRSAGRSACLSVGRFGFGYRVSAVHRSGLRCCLLSLPASLLLPLLPLLPRLSQRCSTKKAGRIQRNFWFSSVLCLDVIRSVREKCSPTSRYREIKTN